MKRSLKIIITILLCTALLCGCKAKKADVITLESVPDYSGSAYIEINGNVPEFTKADMTTEPYEYYSGLDRLGRCRTCYACIGTDIMPDGDRGDISSVKPTGWQQYNFGFIDGSLLYNRCHLIAYMLTGENDNKNNLITGTRYMNIEGMLPFEEKTESYVRETGNHVLYRVTPIFRENELLARGVHMEGYSVEDKGKGISFNVYCYNVQPGVIIDYATGDARAEHPESTSEFDVSGATYIINIKSGKFHRPDCKGVQTMSDKNKLKTNKDRDTLISEGYSPCGECQP